MPKIGAHVSSAVSLDLSFDKAQNIGAECFQIFVSPPRQWSQIAHNESKIEQYLKKQLKTQIGPNFIHGSYLLSLGTGNEEHRNKSIEWLKYALKMADMLQVRGVIFHLGSYKSVGENQAILNTAESIKQILDDAPEKPCIILETSAGSGSNLGSSFSQLGKILKQVGDNRVKVCLDTQHVFAAGYDVKTPIGLKDVLLEFDLEIGLGNLAVIHANDSKSEYKSNVDRHENIGEGFIGKEGFSNLINNPAFANLPFILETPGFAGDGPDKENISALKSLLT